VDLEGLNYYCCIIQLEFITRPKSENTNGYLISHGLSISGPGESATNPVKRKVKHRNISIFLMTIFVILLNQHMGSKLIANSMRI